MSIADASSRGGELLAERASVMVAIDELAPSVKRWVTCDDLPFESPELALQLLTQQHLTAATVEDFCRRSALPIFIAAGPLRHLATGCRACLSAVAAATVPGPELPIAADPFVALLRILATPSTEELNPIERLMLKRLQSDPVAVAWLIFEQCLKIAYPHHQIFPLVMAAGVELVANVTGAISEAAFQRVLCLSRLYMAKARLIGGWDVEAVATRVIEDVDLIESFEVGSPTEDRELLAFFAEVSARGKWQRGLRALAFGLYELEISLLCKPEHAEWRAQVMSDYAQCLNRAGYAERARRIWRRALWELDEEGCPLLQLEVHHNLATIELFLARYEAESVGATEPDYQAARRHLRSSQVLAALYGSVSMLGRRKYLEAMVAEPADPARREAALREVIALCDSRGEVVDAARTLFELIEELIDQGANEVEALVDELTARLAQDSAAAAAFADQLAWLEQELSQRPRYSKGRRRLELLRRLGVGSTVH